MRQVLIKILRPAASFRDSCPWATESLLVKQRAAQAKSTCHKAA